jgi:hypothetical protein
VIELPVYKLRPPLRKPDPTAHSDSSRRSSGATVRPALIHDEPISPVETEVAVEPETSSARVPPSPPSHVSTASSQPERVFFCNVCGKRATGRVPYGWLRVLRSVHPDSLPPDRLLIRRNQNGRAIYADLLVGIFCSAECMERGTSRLGNLVRCLAARGVGMRPLAHGEKPPLITNPGAPKAR